MPKATVQWQLKRIPQLIREAALVCYGVELPDLYVQMVLSGQMSFRDAVADFKSHDSEYAAQARVRH